MTWKWNVLIVESVAVLLGKTLLKDNTMIMNELNRVGCTQHFLAVCHTDSKECYIYLSVSFLTNRYQNNFNSKIPMSQVQNKKKSIPLTA